MTRSKGFCRRYADEEGPEWRSTFIDDEVAEATLCYGRRQPRTLLEADVLTSAKLRVGCYVPEAMKAARM